MNKKWSIESSKSVSKDVFGLLKAKGGSVIFVYSPGAIGVAHKKLHAENLQIGSNYLQLYAKHC